MRVWMCQLPSIPGVAGSLPQFHVIVNHSPLTPFRAALGISPSRTTSRPSRLSFGVAGTATALIPTIATTVWRATARDRSGFLSLLGHTYETCKRPISGPAAETQNLPCATSSHARAADHPLILLPQERCKSAILSPCHPICHITRALYAPWCSCTRSIFGASSILGGWPWRPQ